MSYKLLWGDLHNHNSVGLFNYSKGSLSRTIDIAKSHLDFFCFTGHSHWHDMPEMPNDGHLKWQEGFDHHTKEWPNTKEAIARANNPKKFSAFLGYEWHSAEFGDRQVVFPDDNGDLVHGRNIQEMEEYARKSGALLIPHHLGYKSGLPGRGANWDSINEEFSPVAEIYSEHGGHERDCGPWPYYRHTNGPRTSLNTLQHAWSIGKKLGVTASTDDHFGVPGAYGEGLVAVYALENTREAIFDAIKSRRTYGVTGDRIEMNFTINDAPMGSILPATKNRQIDVSVNAWDNIASVEVIKNNRVVNRFFPEDYPDKMLPFAGNIKLRIEYGWGPWKALSIPRIADWKFNANISGGKFIRYQQCFQSGPFDETRRNLVTDFNKNQCNWISYTGRQDSFSEIPTNAVVLEIKGNEKSVLDLNLDSPNKVDFKYTLGELNKSSVIEFTDRFPCESILIHRIVQEDMYTAGFGFEDGKENDIDFYYVRITQSNGHMAWSSPIWVGG